MASWISKAMRLKIYKRDELKCAYCGIQCKVCDTRTCDDLSNACTLDHIISQKTIYASATDDKHANVMRRDPKNLVVVCMSCNSSKQDTELYTWCAQTSRNYAAIIAEIARRIAIAV